MYTVNKLNFLLQNHTTHILVRYLTATEVSTALRPFYFSVHPDLFGQYPTERAINETSLQHLSSVLQTLQTSNYLRPITLQFYMKKRNDTKVRPVNISLKEETIESAVINILKTCDLPTKDLESHMKLNAKNDQQKSKIKTNYTNMKYRNETFYTIVNMQQQIKEVRENLRLKPWLEENFKTALKMCRNGKATRVEIERIKNELIENIKFKDIKWDCGWNGTHFRACLLALKSLLEQHPEQKYVFEGKILVFSYFTGISLDGHIMLFSGEVRHNWLDFIKNIKFHCEALKRVPFYERSLSHVLRNIKVGRRKFMPKIMVSEYEKNLKQLTTNINEYVGRRAYPSQWPNSLENFELVVENEAGPLMVSPTGQFIVPSAIPGQLLVNFISTNIEEAQEKSEKYKNDKIMEKYLTEKCLNEFNLAAFVKDDNITPELMIECCENLLKNKTVLENYTSDLHVNVSTYYSILLDGVVVIPWNFKC